jgi:hypothetical protein
MVFSLAKAVALVNRHRHHAVAGQVIRQLYLYPRFTVGIGDDRR